MAPQDRLILITGASGFIGSHTVDNFLRHGYKVRLAGRNTITCQRMLQTHATYQAQIDTVIVPDITSPHAFDEAVDGVHGIIHMASPFTYQVQDNEQDLILPAINGVKEVLQSTFEKAPQVERVVMTSSFAAINDFSKGLRPGHSYDETQWNPITYQQTKDDTRGLAYAGSKTLAERAAWAFLSSHPDARFTLATINPVMVYGPPLANSLTIHHLGQSATEIHALMNGTLDSVPPTPMPVFVDVRDVAEAHRLAFETESPGRFALCGGDFTMGRVCELFRGSGLGLEGRVPGKRGHGEAVGEHYGVDTTRAQEVLGLRFRGFEETFLGMAKALLAMESAGGAREQL